MKPSRLVSRGSLDRMFKAAQDAWQSKDYSRYFEVVERARRLDPANSLILTDLGRAYGIRYDYSAAEECFERLLRISPNRPETLGRIMSECSQFANVSLAERYGRLALSEGPPTPDSLVGLAEIHERLNRLEQARELVNRALSIDETHGAGLLLQARLLKRSGERKAAETVLQGALRNARGDLKCKMLYELGSIFDGTGRYDAAMEAVTEAKAMLQAGAEALVAGMERERASIRTQYGQMTAETVSRWHDDDAALGIPIRIAFLLGHPRSGTTLLEQVLDASPGIISAEEPEIILEEVGAILRHEFPSQGDIMSAAGFASAATLREARTEFIRVVERFLGEPVGERLLLVKNPARTYLVPVMARLFPEAKFIYALRDPRDVCVSCYMQSYVPLTRGGVGYLTLNGVVEGYALLLSLWKSFAPHLRNPWMEVKYEDTVSGIESVSRNVLGFLGVEWDPGVLQFDEHARRRQVRSPTYADVTRPLFRTAIGRWRNYEKYLEPHLSALEPSVRSLGYL